MRRLSWLCRALVPSQAPGTALVALERARRGQLASDHGSGGKQQLGAFHSRLLWCAPFASRLRSRQEDAGAVRSQQRCSRLAAARGCRQTSPLEVEPISCLSVHASARRSQCMWAHSSRNLVECAARSLGASPPTSLSCCSAVDTSRRCGQPRMCGRQLRAAAALQDILSASNELEQQLSAAVPGCSVLRSLPGILGETVTVQSVLAIQHANRQHAQERTPRSQTCRWHAGCRAEGEHKQQPTSTQSRQVQCSAVGALCEWRQTCGRR